MTASLPVYDMHATLEAVVEFALSATSSKNLSLDDELVSTYAHMRTVAAWWSNQAYRNSWLHHKLPALTWPEYSWEWGCHTADVVIDQLVL
jgi:hypothetical protein